MADKELEGASLPSGIEVDDAAAYFGVIESSDMVHTLMGMEQEKAMEQFFSILSDIVLLPGDFDFEAASKRIQCEGGEIYYLVAGHLGLMSLPEQAREKVKCAAKMYQFFIDTSPNNPVDQRMDSLQRRRLGPAVSLRKALAC